MNKLLFLYASFGDGHVQVARALEQTFSKVPGVSTNSVDCFRQTNRLIAAMNERLYESLTKWLPDVYGLSYEVTRDLPQNHWLWSVLARFSRRAAWEAILAYQPDVVLQLFPDHALRRLPAKLPKRPKIGVVLTDFAVHSRWFHSGVDFYCLPHDILQSDSHRFIPPSSETVVTGIPIRGQFSECTLQGPPIELPYIVISSGGRGVFPDLIEVVQAIRTSHPTHHIVVLCGRNESLFNLVHKVAADGFVHAVGYQENIATWYQQATFAVVKAGGLTVAECHASGCPMVFYRPQAGQEATNARTCEKLGSGVVVNHRRDLALCLGTLTTERILRMRTACWQAGRPGAAAAVVTEVLRRLKLD